MTTPASTRWRVLGESVRGAAHDRARLPNQDALGWTTADGGRRAALAVADGHGSARCFRSDAGARLAVTVLLDLLRDLDAGAREEAAPSAVKREAEERLPKALVRAWEEKVDFHRRALHPFTRAELRRVQEVAGDAALASIGSDPRVAYGATVVGALLTPEFGLFVQLGDGDVLVVTEEGDVIRPLPPDPRLLGTSTTSLCGDGAWDDVRVSFTAFAGGTPSLVLLTTDGYATSFRDDAGFLRAATDLLGLVRSEGADVVEDHLPGWLAEASALGSGDDTTVVLAVRDVV